uniref:Uncharacterized protein n=1 Tax=Meloidogyne enterolobii TaxID=390850 RepID=A0A6V7W9T1_MELEN|nr:unnamed protein product [Meloidogyne enterolobii]
MSVEKGLLLVPAYPRVRKKGKAFFPRLPFLFQKIPCNYFTNFFKRNIKFLLVHVSLNP